MLEGRANLVPLYRHLHRYLQDQAPRREVLDAIITGATLSGRDRCLAIRDQRRESQRLDQEIKSAATRLSQLLRTRASRCPDIAQNGDYRIYSLLSEAQTCLESPFFQEYANDIGPRILEIALETNPGAWPDLADLLDVVANFSDAHAVGPADPVLDVATSARTVSAQDFIRAINAEVQQLAERSSLIPNAFQLPNPALAGVANTLLAPEEPISDDAVRMALKRSKRR